MTTITELPIEPIRGPAQLLHWLARLPPSLVPALTTVELARDRRVTAATRCEVDLTQPGRYPADIGGPLAVAVLEVPDPGLTAPGREYLLALNTIAEVALLDLLLVADQRWWSVLCKDEACCPIAGRSIRMGERTVEDGHRGWQLAFEGGDVSAVELLAALAHIEVRDLVLTRIIEPTGQSRWEALREQLAAEVLATAARATEHPDSGQSSARAAAAFHCINAVLAYLDADYESVACELAGARGFVPDYSFARLLQQGIDTGAPPELLSAAIRSSADTVQTQIKCA